MSESNSTVETPCVVLDLVTVRPPKVAMGFNSRSAIPRARRGAPDPAAELDRRSPWLARVFDNKSTRIVQVLFEETCGQPKRRGQETRAERE